MIRISPYDERWPAEFDRLADHLRGALGEAARRIDHIGSTAVPSLAAKNVIDVQVTVASLSPAISERLERSGYRRCNVAGDHAPPTAASDPREWVKWLYVEPENARRANVHVRVAGRANQRYALLFRDYLRAHPEPAAAYAELKRRLAASLADPDTYPDVKDPAVDLIYFAAEAWAAETGWAVDGGGDAR